MATGVDTRALETRVKRMYELVTMEPLLPESAVCNADLWASCIGGATPRDHYRDACASYGVRSVSVLASKPRR
ncbi:hypothetical protein [Amycolatopsis thermoflava]|uniref:hypothetical protein n=1 Tax=Amycolatopsis thermoflava TaxID=84480 RepID=UPI000411618E|nr:hypothetical protein [Amycolatopsis thermoflava]